jgi:hypothetical protein
MQLSQSQPIATKSETRGTAFEICILNKFLQLILVTLKFQIDQ